LVGFRGFIRRHVHLSCREREFFIDNLLVRVHFIIMMIRWTGLAPWEFEFPFPGSLTSTFLDLSCISGAHASLSLVVQLSV